MSWALRYRADSDLGRRFTATGGDFPTYQAAEDLRLRCANADDMEVVEIGGEG